MNNINKKETEQNNKQNNIPTDKQEAEVRQTGKQKNKQSSKQNIEQDIMKNQYEYELEIYKRLSAPLPKEAIQQTKKEETHRGYDTVGYGYQFVVNRFNEVLGLTGWGYNVRVLEVFKGTYSNGMPFYDITLEVGIWVLSPNNCRTGYGGNRATFYWDALKGALTNTFKKTAGFWGVGKEAYEGSLFVDEDNRPIPIPEDDKIQKVKEIPMADGKIRITEQQTVFLRNLLVSRFTNVNEAANWINEKTQIPQKDLITPESKLNLGILTKNQASTLIGELTKSQKPPQEKSQLKKISTLMPEFTKSSNTQITEPYPEESYPEESYSEDNEYEEQN